MDFVQVFDDGEGLCQYSSVVELECRDEALRIHLQKVLESMLAAAKLLRDRGHLDALQSQSDAYPVTRQNSSNIRRESFARLRQLRHLEQSRSSHAAADAHGHHHVFDAAPLALDERREHGQA